MNHEIYNFIRNMVKSAASVGLINFYCIYVAHILVHAVSFWSFLA